MQPLNILLLRTSNIPFPSKPVFQRKLCQLLCPTILPPSGSIEESRHSNPVDHQRTFGY